VKSAAMTRSVERAIDLGEAAVAERCTVCEAVAERSICLEAAAGIALGRDASKLDGRTVRACRSCEQKQADTKKYGNRIMMAAMLSMPIVTLGLGFAFRRPDGFATTGGAILALFVARLVIRIIERRRARTIPLLVLGADGDDVLVQVNAPSVLEQVSGYRDAARETHHDKEIARPSPPRASLGLVRAGSLMLTFAAGAVGWSGAFESTHTLVIDSPHDAVTITIDNGAPIALAAGGRSISRISSGTHTYRAVFGDRDRFEDGTFEVSIYDDTLITTDPAQCYFVWVSKGSHAIPHGTGWIRWSRIQNARGSERCANDR
jgi:hypothetical protein